MVHGPERTMREAPSIGGREPDEVLNQAKELMRMMWSLRLNQVAAYNYSMFVLLVW